MKGFVLVELLVATLLFSIAGSGIYAGFLQAAKAESRIQSSFRDYDPARVLFMRLQKDLRNTLVLKDFPFQGKQNEIQFPVAFSEEGFKQLYLIRYFVKNRSLIRSIQKLDKDFRREKAFQKTYLKNFDFLRFQFPYLDEEERLNFKSFWTDEPYFGIPRAVELEFKTKSNQEFLKRVSIPQGKVGRLV